MQNAQTTWYYSRNGQPPQGPVTVQQLRSLAQGGQLLPADLICRPGMSQWIRAGEEQEIFAQATATAGAAPLQYAGPMPVVPGQSIGDDSAMRWLLPVGRSGWAIAAGYLGLFSVIPIFAPFALGLGIIAILDIKKHPGRHGMGRAIFGVVMGSVFSLLLIFALVATAFSR